MVCNKSDHKKYAFVLVLYLIRDIGSFKSEKVDTAKLSRTGLIYNKKDIPVSLNCKRFILKRNAKFLEV